MSENRPEEAADTRVEKIRAVIRGENPLERKRAQQAAYRERKRLGKVKGRKKK